MTKDEARELLTSYANRFQVIEDILAKGKAHVQPDKHRAQNLLKELKEDLAAECKRLEKVKEKTRWQDAFAEPAMRAAKAHLLVAVNTVPDGKWLDNLYRCRTELTFMLGELKD